MKVSELTGAQLDWAVAKCEGYECKFDDEILGAWLVPEEGYLHDEKPLSKFNPSTNWAQGGPIIQWEKIGILPSGNAYYELNEGTYYSYGTTPLIASMRCYVASKLGDEIELPEELL
jgi:hypothetical protein